MSIIDWLVVIAALVILLFGHTPPLVTALVAAIVIVALRIARGERI